MAELKNIQRVVLTNQLAYSHYTLARFIYEAIPEATELSLWFCVLVSLEIDKGNVCLEITDIHKLSEELGWQQLPPLQEIYPSLIDSAVIGSAFDNKPLIFDQQKLYLNRYYHYENRIAQYLISRPGSLTGIDTQMCSRIDNLFDQSDARDYQKLAAIVSQLNPLCIISGGPGTGKTWTVSKIIALLLMQDSNLNIRLAAPTGKAAARLSDSILTLIPTLGLDDVVAQKIPVQAQTLHRLLGIHRFTHRPRYHLKQKLDCDVLVLDEASMIDQQMMALTCAALTDDCKLILLGDKDQLSSVEAGSVFADLCGELSRSEFYQPQQQFCQQYWDYDIPIHENHFALANSVVVLEKSHRFDTESGIGKLAQAVKKGDSVESLRLLRSTADHIALSWHQPLEAELSSLLKEKAGPEARAMMQSASISAAFQCFHRFQVLAAVWRGPFGVDTINRILEEWLKSSQGLEQTDEFYPGKPLMMTANAYQFGIHNGDIGIVWPDENKVLKIWFEQGKDQYRALSLSQCPEHKTAYAMTVHKSQGSEFDKVLLVLPNMDTALLSREMLYTGITRAASAVELWAQESIIERAVQQRTRRTSGLMQRLVRPASRPTYQPSLF